MIPNVRAKGKFELIGIKLIITNKLTNNLGTLETLECSSLKLNKIKIRKFNRVRVLIAN